MRRLDVQIPTPDGRSNGFRTMGDRLASMGYVVLIPDIYYRAGEWAPVDVATVFTDPQERARMMALSRALTHDRTIADSAAYADFLMARPEVAGSAIGTTGYCLGGRMSLFTAVQAGLLESALTAAGVDHTIEFYPAHHGFAVSDNPTYDAEADARHWAALDELCLAQLRGS